MFYYKVSTIVIASLTEQRGSLQDSILISIYIDIYNLYGLAQ